MDKYRMLENIKVHSIVVARVAHLIARGLRDAGLDISIKKATAGALIHDIGKTASLNSSEDHSETGRRICLENDLHEIADIVGEHVILKDYKQNGKFSEKEIVYYSDKRVNHDRIVSLKERLAYIIERYGKKQAERHHAILMNFELCKKVEKKLFSKLTFSPKSLRDLAKDERIGEICPLQSDGTNQNESTQ
jgi:putative nucleotidyltransferase with HDIG domain